MAAVTPEVEWSHCSPQTSCQHPPYDPPGGERPVEPTLVRTSSLPTWMLTAGARSSLVSGGDTTRVRRPVGGACSRADRAGWCMWYPLLSCQVMLRCANWLLRAIHGR